MEKLNGELIREVLEETLNKTPHYQSDSFSVQPIKNGFSLYFFGVAFFRLIQQKEKIKTEIKCGLLEAIDASEIIVLKLSPDRLWSVISVLNDPIEFLRAYVLEIYE